MRLYGAVVAVASLVCLLETVHGCVFGADCTYPCHCQDAVPCDPYNGSCPNSCDDGDIRNAGDDWFIGPWSGYACQIGNIAYRRPTENFPDTWLTWESRRAVDGGHNPGMYNGSCTYTFQPEVNQVAWFQVDLRYNYVIISVNITNRIGVRGGYTDLLSYTTIEIRPENGTEFDYQLCYWLDDIGEPPFVHVYCQQYTKGRFVRLRRDTSGPGSHTLNLCEVQVYGYLFDECPANYTGVACATPCDCPGACDDVTGDCIVEALEETEMETPIEIIAAVCVLVLLLATMGTILLVRYKKRVKDVPAGHINLYHRDSNQNLVNSAFSLPEEPAENIYVTCPSDHTPDNQRPTPENPKKDSKEEMYLGGHVGSPSSVIHAGRPANKENSKTDSKEEMYLGGHVGSPSSVIHAGRPANKENSKTDSKEEMYLGGHVGSPSSVIHADPSLDKDNPRFTSHPSEAMYQSDHVGYPPSMFHANSQRTGDGKTQTSETMNQYDYVTV